HEKNSCFNLCVFGRRVLRRRSQRSNDPLVTRAGPRPGLSLLIPRALFSQIEGDGKRAFHYFMSPNSEAKFMVGAWNNREGRPPDQFKRWLMHTIVGYDEVTYRPRGRSWFVLSGYRGDDIYYEKVMFSCGGQVVNVMAVTYPSVERDVCDPVVERMEDGCRPGRSCS